MAAVSSADRRLRPAPGRPRGGRGRGPRPASKTVRRSRGWSGRSTRRRARSTIAHEAIPGFMPGMTMPFTLKDQAGWTTSGPATRSRGRSGSGPRRRGQGLTTWPLTVTRPGRRSTLDLGRRGPGLPKPPDTLKPGEPVPDFAVTTQDGRTLRLSDLRGEVVVLTFIYTRCPLPEFCPAMDAKFAELARRIAAVPGRAEPGPAALGELRPRARHAGGPGRARRRRRGRGRRSGPSRWPRTRSCARVAGPLGPGLRPGSGEIDHNLRAAVIGPDGRLGAAGGRRGGGAWPRPRSLKAVDRRGRREGLRPGRTRRPRM